MDSREPPQPAPPPHLQSQPPSAPPNMMLGHVLYGTTMPNPNSTPIMMAPNTARFPYNQPVQQQQQPPPPPPPSKPSEAPSNTSPFDGSSSSSALRPCGFNMDSAKKKRGRPRKYSPDGGNIALGLAPTPMSSSSGPGDLSGTPSGEPSAKKNRGRPPGSGKKQLDALGAGGVGFTPHVILVNPGEDIGAKIMAFAEQGPRAICILSANGAICNANLKQPTMSGGVMQYEGRHEIISLSGSFLASDSGGTSTRKAGGLSVSLADADGKVVGGGVVGMLIAASPVQVIVGSFIPDGKKSSSNVVKSGPSPVPGSQMLNFGASMTPTSPTSQGGSSDDSDDNGDSPFNRGPGPGPGPGPGVYNNVNQPIHNMQWNHPQLWASQTQQ